MIYDGKMYGTNPCSQRDSFYSKPWKNVLNWCGACVRGPILENHGMLLSLQISFLLYRKWHAIIFKNRAPDVLTLQCIQIPFVPLLWFCSQNSILHYFCSIQQISRVAFPVNRQNYDNLKKKIQISELMN
jgi:hypothetical protein